MGCDIMSFMKIAVIKTGGKQYVVRKDDEIVVDKLGLENGVSIEFETLAMADVEKATIELGMPVLKEKVKGTVVETVKGEKIRVARFKAKSRYRKVKGFRSQLSKVKIVSI